MASSESTQDNRLLQREHRSNSSKAIEADPGQDLAENVAPADEEELGRLKEDLEVEKVARDERVQRALEAPPEPIAPPPPVAPLAEFEND